ncbi:MAG: PEP-CTERM sorting domain-containing protein [Opitutales bacterium]|jgi:hypothetical protein|tara:strand:+ start:360 stop:941 length:582 start_codon:yes stop_codon:yes gene_type:complete
MKPQTPLLTLITIAAFNLSVSAQTFTFGSNTSAGQAQADFDDLASGSTISGGLTLTATASSGTFNSTPAGGFGINANASDDITNQFDNKSTDGAEFMTFSFNQNVDFVSIELTEFGADEAFLTIAGITTIIGSNSFIFASGTTLAANTDATFGFHSGNGFELASLVVAVVPEPGTYALLSGCCALAAVMLRRR